FSYKSTKDWMTCRDLISSRVKEVRDQSQDAPRFFNCCRMIPPYLSVHSQAYSTNFSRLISPLLIPFSLSQWTTLASVAMEAWSVPGTQQAFFPSSRALRIRISWMLLLSICPIWSTPVTLGGGMTIVYGSRLSGWDSNMRCFSQDPYHFSSTDPAS